MIATLTGLIGLVPDVTIVLDVSRDGGSGALAGAGRRG